MVGYTLKRIETIDKQEDICLVCYTPSETVVNCSSCYGEYVFCESCVCKQRDLTQHNKCLLCRSVVCYEAPLSMNYALRERPTIRDVSCAYMYVKSFRFVLCFLKVYMNCCMCVLTGSRADNTNTAIQVFCLSTIQRDQQIPRRLHTDEHHWTQSSYVYIESTSTYAVL